MFYNTNSVVLQWDCAEFICLMCFGLTLEGKLCLQHNPDIFGADSLNKSYVIESLILDCGSWFSKLLF
jgi:hypothetical protein